MSLTPRQAQVLEMIRAHVAATGAPPTRAEIAHALGFRSPNAAEAHLRALARKGVVALRPGAARGIQVLWADGVEGPAGTTGAPAIGSPAAGGAGRAGLSGGGLQIVGRVAAGSPLLAQENVEGRLGLDPGAFSPRADYLLRVQGESMRDAGILDGDLLAVHRTPVAEDGQIVVARLTDMEDEVTVKRFERRGDTVLLHPANPDFAPIRVDLRRHPLAQVLTIEGRGVGVLRRGLLP